jgi:hypothetical protein
MHLIAELTPADDKLVVTITGADRRIIRDPINGLLEGNREVLREQLACRTATGLTICGRRLHLSSSFETADAALYGTDQKTYRLRGDFSAR